LGFSGKQLGNRRYFIRLFAETQLAGWVLGKKQDWGELAVQRNGKVAIIFSWLNTADHSSQEGQIFTVVTYHRYMRMGDGLEDNIDVIGGECGWCVRKR